MNPYLPEERIYLLLHEAEQEAESSSLRYSSSDILAAMRQTIAACIEKNAAETK